MKHLVFLMLLVAFALPAIGQNFDVEEQAPKVMGGFLFQTALTQESYVITKSQDLKSLVTMIPPVTPYKNLPPPPNPDPFLKGFTVNFEESVLVVAVGRDRVEDPPLFEGVEWLADGSRQVNFSLTARSEPHPFGYAVYSAVILPRAEGSTRVVVTTLPDKRETKNPRRKFRRL